MTTPLYAVSPDELTQMVTQAVRDALRGLQGRTEATPWMTTKEAAEYLRVTPQALYQKVHMGEVPYRKVGSSIRFNRDRLDEWIDTGVVAD